MLPDMGLIPAGTFQIGGNVYPEPWWYFLRRFFYHIDYEQFVDWRYHRCIACGDTDPGDTSLKTPLLPT